MLDINDFSKKQIIVFMPTKGDKLSYRNDNIIISDSEGKVKYQHTCYRIFCLIVIGDCTITTGLLRRAKKYAFTICFMSYNLRLYSVIKSGLKGNNMLHQKQYEYSGTGLARTIVYNKVLNQRNVLNLIRKKTDFVKEGIDLLDGYLHQLQSTEEWELHSLLGVEGNAAKVFFPRIFENTQWKSRRPRVKSDYVNSLLDIGYTILFNFVECLLNVYDFDVYQGVLHTNFYMRKSLVCNLMEPFRAIIDWRVRKGINLGQFKNEDFVVINNQFQLEYKKSNIYTMIFLEDILENKENIFLYIRGYYRSFMKGKNASEFPIFDMSSEEISLPLG